MRDGREKFRFVVLHVTSSQDQREGEVMAMMKAREKNVLESRWTPHMQ